MVKKLVIFMALWVVFAPLPTSASELYGTLKKIKDSGQIVLIRDWTAWWRGAPSNRHNSSPKW